MAIHKAHNGFCSYNSIFCFVCIFICNVFPAAVKEKYVFYIDWAGLFNSIVAFPDLGGQ